MKRLDIAIPEKLAFLLQDKARYKVAYGGRGSSKSWSFARALLVRAMGGKVRILCAREVQKSIKDSVHRLLSDQIEAMGLGAFFEVLRDEIRCTKTGSQFLFTGLADHTVETVKSFEGAGICWVEEAQTVSDRSWSILIPTIRAAGSEIWITFNPDQETDPTFQRFVVNAPPDAIVREVNWDDNPWFPEELAKEKDYLYRVDPEAAAHVWGGQCRKTTDAQILRGRWRLETFEPKPHWEGPYHGADWGFATDPTAGTRVWIDGRTLYVEHEVYGFGIEVDHLPALFDELPDARKVLTRADNARPETISYMQRQGFNFMAAEKWPGSVEDGTEYLRSFEAIVIHPRCKHTAEEARLYSYKTDRMTGEIRPEIVDKHNHCMDAIRYSLTPMIRGYRKVHAFRVDLDDDVSLGLPNGSGWMAG